MKKTTLCILGAAALLCCAASCGSHPVSNAGVKASVDTTRNKTDAELRSEMTGKWETTNVYLGGVEKDKEDADMQRFELKDDGSGFYYTSDDEKQYIKWRITADGGADINFEDMGEKTEHYDYIGYNFRQVTDTPDGERIVCFSRVGDFTKPVTAVKEK